ncbi:hypothetical protein B0J14DRAFT_662947 [Halenospora varia]|nr:hypothetical protein B0J14DRAFT_662947 [Halenospora varia]
MAFDFAQNVSAHAQKCGRGPQAIWSRTSPDIHRLGIVPSAAVGATKWPELAELLSGYVYPAFLGNNSSSFNDGGLSAIVKANMTNTNIVKSISDAPFQDFASSILPLYNGPHVSIRIGSTSPDEFKVPKALLCKQSPYFAATFEGDFKEARDHSTILEEVDGVVTTRSFQMLL